MVRIEISPPNASVPAGLSLQLVAIGVFSDSTMDDVTSQVTWRSGREASATVSADGVVTAVAPGTVAITARLGTVTGAVVLTVTDAELVSIEVAPSNLSLPKGVTRQLTATGTFTDRSRLDLTRDVTWTSSAPQFVRVSNQLGSQGVATAAAVGTARIFATLTGKTGDVTVEVTSATILSIDVGPPAVSMPKGRSQHFAATALFTDQARIDVTGDVLWMSSAPDVAPISNEVGSQGVATAAAVGTAILTATLQGKTDSATMEVTAAVLERLQVSPGFASVPKGLVQQFTATGTFSDQSERDVTEEVLWASSNATVAPIANDPGSRGKATAGAVGQTMITARTSSVSATPAQLQVTAAQMVGIEVNPANPRVPRGPLSEHFSAIVIFTDGSSSDVTGAANWTSSNPAVAEMSTATNGKGFATVKDPGTAIIGATFGALSGSTTLTVTNATLVSAEVRPAEFRCLPGTIGFQLRAIGTFSDQSTRDLTEDMTWQSSNFLVARVSRPLPPPFDEIDTRCVAAGDATISATRGGVHGECHVHVGTIAALSIDPHSPSVPVGGNLQLTATAFFPDQTHSDFTTVVTWASSNPAVAQISNASGEWGRVTGVAPGSVTLSATFDGLTATTTLDVQ